MHDAGLRVVMATGDGLTTAKGVGRRLSIDEVHGEVKPEDKLRLVEELQAEGRIVAMAGDEPELGLGDQQCAAPAGRKAGQALST